MKKTLILGLIVMLAATVAYATDTRVLTLGENNNVLVDDANQWLYPSRVFNYPNIAVGEFATSGVGSSYPNDFYSFGLNWKFGEQKPWVLGTYFSTQPNQLPAFYHIDDRTVVAIPGFQRLFDYEYYSAPAPGGAAADAVNNVNTNRRVELLYGRKLGTMTFGFGFGYTSSSWTSEVPSNQSTEKFGQFRFKFGLTPEAGNWDIAAAISMGSFNKKDSIGTEQLKQDGYSDIALYGRFFHKLNNMITLVPHVGVAIGTHGVDYDTTYFGGNDTKTKLTSIEIGSGLHYTPVTNVLAVLDFGLQYRKVKTEVTPPAPAASSTAQESGSRLPYWKIGVEGDVFNWMDVRFGAVSNWTNFKEDDVSSQKYADNNTFLGVGLNFNRLHIDTYTDPQILLDGFNFISGSSDAEDLNFNVSVLYEMF